VVAQEKRVRDLKRSFTRFDSHLFAAVNVLVGQHGIGNGRQISQVASGEKIVDSRLEKGFIPSPRRVILLDGNYCALKRDVNEIRRKRATGYRK